MMSAGQVAMFGLQAVAQWQESSGQQPRRLDSLLSFSPGSLWMGVGGLVVLFALILYLSRGVRHGARHRRLRYLGDMLASEGLDPAERSELRSLIRREQDLRRLPRWLLMLPMRLLVGAGWLGVVVGGGELLLIKAGHGTMHRHESAAIGIVGLGLLMLPSVWREVDRRVFVRRWRDDHGAA